VAHEVTVPQLGESVTEGTITAWLVAVGDHVEADQPLYELSSDKIDTEVPSPVSGVLTEIRVEVDQTVDVGTVVAIIGGDGDGAGAPAQEAAPAEQPSEPAEQATPAEQAAPAEQAPEPAGEPSPAADGGGQGALTSPLVRRLAREHDVDLTQVPASGAGGRVTRSDVEQAIGGQRQGSAPARPPARSAPLQARDRERLEDLSRVRQRIAGKMIESMQSSAQLTTVGEADVTRVMRIRNRFKEAFQEREGASLSPFAFMARAAVIAVKRHPTLNAQADWDGAKVRFHEYVNLGIAVDTDKGLLVPNVKSADDLTLPALARAIADIAGRARGEGGKLEMQDIEGGTFTVTNTGSRGVLIDTPILNYPEVAILGTGKVQKRPVVVATDGGDAIAIREMVYLCLTYDHQLIDGADAARYVTDVAEVLETHDWEAELGY
jgi:pyruvate dehydrogenase E2 component (dihydrolipoamide acetyltransferase)